MKGLLIAIALAAGVSFSAAAPATAATRNYDCSKPGNANKTACNGGAKATAAKAAPARPVAKTTTTSNKTTTTTRQYDCTKAGNANKTACKTAAAEAGAKKVPGAVKTTTSSTATTTDCTKWYNKVRAQCRTTTTAGPARTTVAPAPKPTATAPKSAANENANPAGATAQCKDGTYSHAKTHQGACSHHGGVAKWL